MENFAGANRPLDLIVTLENYSFLWILALISAPFIYYWLKGLRAKSRKNLTDEESESLV